MTVAASEGWGVLHLFFHLRTAALEDPAGAAKDFVERAAAFRASEHQLLAFSVLGQKADLGLMLLGPDLEALDRFVKELVASPLGAGLIPAGSYVSLTEVSEYSADADPAYLEHRLHPRLPQRQVLCFYPMSKRRDPGANWFALPFEDRKQLMLGHAEVGRSYRGRVLQLITTSTGLDDWEWGVTLLADDPKAIAEIVYEMRFDEVSARYAEFGAFVIGLVKEPEALVSHLGLVG